MAGGFMSMFNEVARIAQAGSGLLGAIGGPGGGAARDTAGVARDGAAGAGALSRGAAALGRGDIAGVINAATSGAQAAGRATQKIGKHIGGDDDERYPGRRPGEPVIINGDGRQGQPGGPVVINPSGGQDPRYPRQAEQPEIAARRVDPRQEPQVEITSRRSTPVNPDADDLRVLQQARMDEQRRWAAPEQRVAAAPERAAPPEQRVAAAAPEQQQQVAAAPARHFIDGGEQMKDIQAHLKLAGLYDLGIDGISGDGTKTEAGIGEFLETRGLEGINPRDNQAVLAALQNDPQIQQRMAAVVGQGMQADDSLSRAVQTIVNADVDGDIGEKTAAAYAEYAADHTVHSVADAAPTAAPGGFRVGEGPAIAAHHNDRAEMLAQAGFDFPTATGPVARVDGTQIGAIAQGGRLETPAQTQTVEAENTATRVQTVSPDAFRV